MLRNCARTENMRLWIAERAPHVLRKEIEVGDRKIVWELEP